MFEVMKLLVKNKYNRLIFPEHPRGWIPTRRYPRALAPPPPAGPMMWPLQGDAADRLRQLARPLSHQRYAQKQKAPHR